MISIIVSSYKEEYYRGLERNVQDTIGVNYELIRIYNPGTMGTCEAYNRGAAKAQYNYLCFCHEDILFETHGWGLEVIKAFTSEENVGLIGVAGSAYQSWVPSGWNATQDKFKAVNLVHQDKSTGHPFKLFSKSGTGEMIQVIALDGCFLFTSRQVYNSYQFDATTFQNYHCYDVDFSLQVGQAYKVCVTYSIVLAHLSVGSFDKTWLSETLKLYSKWRRRFPLFIKTTGNRDIRIEEEGAFYRLAGSVGKVRAGYLQLLKTYFNFHFINLVGIRKWLYIPYSTARIIQNERRFREKKL